MSHAKQAAAFAVFAAVVWVAGIWGSVRYNRAHPPGDDP